MAGRVIVLIPARGGSKGVRRKNLQRYKGVPLVAHAIRTAQEAFPTSIIVCSTDDPEIATVARLCGATVEERDPALATDTATVDEVVHDFRHRNPHADVLLLQPTVPEITPDNLRDMDQHWDGAGITFGGVEERHLYWQGNEQLTIRANRQEIANPLIREIGVRLYPIHDETTRPPRTHVFDGPINDIDSWADLQAARASAAGARILFRCVYGDEVGSGHYRRCLAIAAELPQHDIHFESVADEGFHPELPGLPYPLIQAAVTETHNDYDLIVNDTLDTEPTWTTRTLWLENMLPVPGVVVNALYKPAMLTPVQKAQVDEGRDVILSDPPTVYTGPEWADIRPEFTVVPPYEPSGEGRVLLTFGGTDPAGMTDRLVGELATIGLRGRPGDPMPRVRVMSRDRQDFPSMGEAMAWADLVVTSGGRTVYEALACNRPVIAVPVNERERTHEALANYGTIHWDLRDDLPALAEHIVWLATTPDQLVEQSEAGRGVVDGRGTERIAALIEGMLL